jgi:beta-barrel assembly-enhancing protease
MSHSWPARYLDGVTAHAESVTVTPVAHGLEIRRADGEHVVWRYTDVTQTQGGYSGEQVRLERGRGAVEALVIDDAAFLSQLHRVAPRVSRRFHDPRSRARRPFWLALALLTAVLLGGAAYFWGIPAAATFVADRVPVAWEEELGRTVSESLIGTERKCRNAQVTAAVDAMIARLAAASPDNPYTFRVTVVQRDVVNAFAAPGGHIVVFSGLLHKTERPEELAGVLAHEMSHVLRRHGTKALFRDVSTSIFFSLLLGDAGGAMGAVLESAKTLGDLHYSRAAEEEADSDGLKMVDAAGIDPAAMISFFEKLEQRRGAEPDYLKYVSTHPLTRDRIARLRAERALNGTYAPLGDGGTWKHIASACNP